MTNVENLAIVFHDILHAHFIITLARKGFKVFLRTEAERRMIVGTEWLIEAAGCNAAALRDESTLRLLFDRIIYDLGLKSIGSIWHTFEGEGGVTGLIALTESHLACHTYPENGTATFNLYCCRTRPEWDWETNLREALGAQTVMITRIERGNEQMKSVGGDA